MMEAKPMFFRKTALPIVISTSGTCKKLPFYLKITLNWELV
jgi:hypothetical protein